MKNVMLFLGVLTCFYSCKKTDDSLSTTVNNSGNTAVDNSSYTPMSVGNYWIYQEYNIDSVGNVTQSSTVDSTVISKDTLINGKKYFRFDKYEYYSKVASPNLIDITYYRDSSKNLINSEGKIMFSELNLSDTLYRKTEIMQGDTLYWMTCKMEKTVDNVTTPSGIYSNLLNFKNTVKRNTKFTPIKEISYNNNFYANNIGKVLYSYGFICI